MDIGWYRSINLFLYIPNLPHLLPPPSGHYGADCSLSLGPDGRPEILLGLGYTPAKRKPMVYIYEVPPRFNTW